MDTYKLEMYAELKTKIKELGEEADTLKEQAAKLEQELFPAFMEDGISKTTIRGNTVWLQRQLWAGAENKNVPWLAEALNNAGMNEMVREAVPVQTLSAWVREFDEGGMSPEEIKTEMVAQGVPLEVVERLRITEKFSLRVRKS